MTDYLSTQPYKGSRDFYPPEMQIRNYIFDTWKKVCKSFGYQEYDGPFIESFDLYAAKTGEEIVNEQLYSFTDRGDRKVAIRPEMTPTLARMVARQYKTLVQPIRWFSIPNLWRYEKPQKGRLREHYQLNIDIFGVESPVADFEIINILINIMLSLGGQEDQFRVKIGNRRMLDEMYSMFGIEQKRAVRVTKALDKIAKLPQNEFKNLLKDDANLSEIEISKILDFVASPEEIVTKLAKQNSIGAREVQSVLELAEQNNMKNLVEYSPTIVRGLDYYTGNVMELYDLSPSNNRAMAGGGRYDDLVTLFTGNKLTGVGAAMGDVTLLNFLTENNLLPQLNSDAEYLVTLWPENSQNRSNNNENNQIATQSRKYSNEIAQKLRQNGKNVIQWLEEEKIEKQIRFADRRGIKKVVIAGPEEQENKTITIKDLSTGNQETVKVESCISKL